MPLGVCCNGGVALPRLKERLEDKGVSLFCKNWQMLSCSEPLAIDEVNSTDLDQRSYQTNYILSQWAWFSMSTRNFIGSGQNSAHPLLENRWIALSVNYAG